jgi:hypothetical protein
MVNDGEEDEGVYDPTPRAERLVSVVAKGDEGLHGRV